MSDEAKLRVAIDRAREGQAAGNDPYGAAIFDGHQLVAAEHNRVATTRDPIAHAEVEALRTAYRAVGREGLARCTLFTTCEPCPLCMGAIRWLGLAGFVYGSRDRTHGGAESGAPEVKRVASQYLASAECDRLQREAKAG